MKRRSRRVHAHEIQQLERALLTFMNSPLGSIPAADVVQAAAYVCDLWQRRPSKRKRLKEWLQSFDVPSSALDLLTNHSRHWPRFNAKVTRRLTVTELKEVIEGILTRCLNADPPRIRHLGGAYFCFDAGAQAVKQKTIRAA